MDAERPPGGAAGAGGSLPPGKDQNNGASSSAAAQGGEVQDVFSGIDTWALAAAAVLVLLGLVNASFNQCTC